MQRMYQGILWGILLLLFLENARQTEAAEAFTITKYVVTVLVSQDNVYHIKEEIGVCFNEARHGIYRDIPVSYTVSREDGSSNKVYCGTIMGKMIRLWKPLNSILLQH